MVDAPNGEQGAPCCPAAAYPGSPNSDPSITTRRYPKRVSLAEYTRASSISQRPVPEEVRRAGRQDPPLLVERQLVGRPGRGVANLVVVRRNRNEDASGPHFPVSRRWVGVLPEDR